MEDDKSDYNYQDAEQLGQNNRVEYAKREEWGQKKDPQKVRIPFNRNHARLGYQAIALGEVSGISIADSRIIINPAPE